MVHLRLALSLIAVLPLPAAAKEQPSTVRVSYADLDLRSSEGRKALDRRLKHAASLVCPDSRGTKDVGRLQSTRHCMAEKLGELAPAREIVIARRDMQASTAIDLAQPR